MTNAIPHTDMVGYKMYLSSDGINRGENPVPLFLSPPPHHNSYSAYPGKPANGRRILKPSYLDVVVIAGFLIEPLRQSIFCMTCSTND